jgi:hypothetical protein
MSPAGQAAHLRKEALSMAKVFGMHMIALLPGVKAEDFEKFVAEEVYQVPSLEGVKYYLLKGDRGDREGKYLWMMEIESVEARDRLFPSPGEMSEEVQQSFAALAPVLEKWATFATPMDIITTDYVVVGK